MLKRRKVLIGLGGIISIAGCSGESEEEPSEGEGPDSSPEQEDTEQENSTEQEDAEQEESDPDELEPEEGGEAVFEFVSVSPENETLSTEEEITVEAEVENTGTTAGEDAIEFRIEDEIVEEKQVVLESGEVTTVGIDFDPSDIDPGTVGYSVHSGTDSISSEFTLEQPLEQWEKEMKNAEELFQDGLNTYAAQGDGPTDSILDVMFSMKLGWTDIHSKMNKANKEAGPARSAVSRDSEKYDTITNAMSEIQLINEFSRYQSKHHDLYEIFVSTYGTLLDEEAEWPEPQLTEEYTSIEESFEEKKVEFEELEPEFSDPELYDKKMEQMRSELDTADMIITGINYILDPGFGILQERAALAKREFSDVLDFIEDEDAYPPEGAVDQEYIEIVTDWHKLAEDIERELRTI